MNKTEFVENYTPVVSKPVILLVEDDDGVRRLVRLILESRGYLVLDACNGADGLALCGAHKGRIDLLLSDVMMPRLGGRELAHGAMKMRPDLRVLFMSGHNEDIVEQDGMCRGNGFLQKPFTSGALTQKIVAAMAAPMARSAEA
jgi:CheY-like chemotaxis protein